MDDEPERRRSEASRASRPRPRTRRRTGLPGPADRWVRHHATCVRVAPELPLRGLGDDDAEGSPPRAQLRSDVRRRTHPPRSLRLGARAIERSTQPDPRRPCRPPRHRRRRSSTTSGRLGEHRSARRSTGSRPFVDDLLTLGLPGMPSDSLTPLATAASALLRRADVRVAVAPAFRCDRLMASWSRRCWGARRSGQSGRGERLHLEDPVQDSRRRRAPQHQRNVGYAGLGFFTGTYTSNSDSGSSPL